MFSHGILTFFTCAKYIYYIIYHSYLEIYLPCTIHDCLYVTSQNFRENSQGEPLYDPMKHYQVSPLLNVIVGTWHKRATRQEK